MAEQPVRQGYYLPCQQLLGGEVELAVKAKSFYTDRLGLDSKRAGRYDGCTIIVRGDGSTIVRTMRQNPATHDRVDVRVQDTPLETATPSTFRPYICGECGGQIDLRHPDGDFINLKRGGQRIFVPIPTYLLVPKCGYCGEVFLGETEGQKIAQTLGGELA